MLMVAWDFAVLLSYLKGGGGIASSTYGCLAMLIRFTADYY